MRKPIEIALQVLSVVFLLVPLALIFTAFSVVAVAANEIENWCDVIMDYLEVPLDRIIDWIDP